MTTFAVTTARVPKDLWHSLEELGEGSVLYFRESLEVVFDRYRPAFYASNYKYEYEQRLVFEL